MSLFAQLQSLYRPDRFLFEDFHTEIVAQVLRNSTVLTLEWLRGIGATDLANADHVNIDTQETFLALAGHSTASRPDITIRLVSGARKELVFVESKQDSVQGDDQLQRYADHLHAAQNREDLVQVSLVFITRDYESAEKPLWRNEPLQWNFQRTRWFQFYRYLKAHVNGDGLANQLKLFMEENRMSLGNQFRSTDLVALENFLSAKALMDETLDGEVIAEARRVLDSVEGTKKSGNQLRDHHRYIICNSNWTVIACMIGYWLPQERVDDRVRVGITLESKDSPARHAVIAAFRDWVKKGGGAWSLDDESGGSSMRKGKELQCFSGEDDHIRSIQNYFIELLREVEDFQKSYPNVPWI